MDREEFHEKIEIAFKNHFFSKDGGQITAREISKELADLIVNRILDDWGFSVVNLRQCGWLDPNDHVLYELDTDEEFALPTWRPVYELGKTAINLPPSDLDDVDAWKVTE